MSVFVSQNSQECQFSTGESWVILSPIEHSIKHKIEAAGTPLKDWDINIYRGILTGYNEAFIIDGKKKDELIAEDPKSAEIIRPILRGRDIKRYSCEFADLYIITTFPSLKIDIEEYPAIKQHLLSFGYDRLKQTSEPGARKKTNNQWFETQDAISYWEDLNSQKIIWGEISDKTKFSIDLNGDFANEATTFLMTGKSLIYLLGYLNSKLSEYLFSKIGTTTGVGTVRWKKFTIEQLLVPNLDLEGQSYLESVALEIIEAAKHRKETVILEKKFNTILYKYLDFNEKEKSFIESQ